jgi:hypothetical protein
MRIHNSPDCSNYQIPKQQAIELYPIVSQRRPVDKKSSIFGVAELGYDEK